jgi:polysaccharide export outer membrane protein
MKPAKRGGHFADLFSRCQGRGGSTNHRSDDLTGVVSYQNVDRVADVVENLLQMKAFLLMMKFSSLPVSLFAISVAGCSSLPTAGPTASEIIDQETVEGVRHFDIIKIDNRVVGILSTEPAASLRSWFEKYGKPPAPNIGIGDTVSVVIYETAAGGLSGAASVDSTQAAPVTGTRSTPFPEQVVGRDGEISVPNVGRLHVAGLTPVQVQKAIDKKLAERAIEPQAIVTVTKSVSNTATVSGEVVNGAQLPLSVRGERLLNVIAAAGGARSPLYETFVRLSRGGVTATVAMDTLVSKPEENIYVWPGDVITLVRKPQTYTMFGATLNNAQLPFGADRINLAQAIAKAGGLQDQRADPEGVFLFRFESPPVVEALRAPMVPERGSNAPIVYHLDLRDVDGYFLAKKFPVKEDDLIYVANASLTDVQKLFTMIGTITGPIIGGVVVSRSTP